MFQSVLIANRGEIACRIARTARALGMRTIAVYSEADRDALHVRMCDEAHLIGPAPAADSYLAIDKIIAAAQRADAQCIHPGYGFLSERPEFAEACAAADIVFVGPPPDAIRAMGLKDRAKALMEKAGVPVVPGYHGQRQEPKFLKEKAYEIGYPVLIKAVAGGGGKGMRRVAKHSEFDSALEGAIREAEAAFGDTRVLIEKYVSAPRHVEMQVFADRHGEAIYLYERDCSLQRRHQKVIEEAPAPGMPPAARDAMGLAAVEAAKAVGYVGAGTVEFIVDSSRGIRPDGFWFMEMNTRLQVEHPVTEAVTGLDLVELQFRVAAGEPLPLSQNEVPLKGHAVEARLYAEDPEHGFLPSTGRLVALELPAGEAIRVDTGVEAGAEVTSFYDPMIAKIIAHASTREQALARLTEALRRTIVAGPRTNTSFLAALCEHSNFLSGRFDTAFIDRHLHELGAGSRRLDAAAAAAGVAHLIAREEDRIARRAALLTTEPFSPWKTNDSFQLTGKRDVSLPVMVDGEPHAARVEFGEGGARVTLDNMEAAEDAVVFEGGEAVYVLRKGRQTVVRLKDFDDVDVEHLDDGGHMKAPMSGKVIAVYVQKGDWVEKGQRVAIIEAMKMEHALQSPMRGTIVEVGATAGMQIAEGAKVAVVSPAKEEA